MNKFHEIKKLELKREFEVKNLSERLVLLENEKEQLEKNLKRNSKFQEKYYNEWDKYPKRFVIFITLSILLITISFVFIILDLDRNIQINKWLKLNLGIDLWNNLILLGLSMLAMSFIFYQLEKSTRIQMQINIFWKEWDSIEKLSKDIQHIQNEIIMCKLDKYINSLPILYVKGKRYVPKDSLDPENVKDPDLKFILAKFKFGLDKMTSYATKDLAKKRAVLSPGLKF